jgi:amidase
MSRLWQLGALQLAAKIRSGDVTSRAVVEAHLARIDSINPDLNAIVRRLDDEALTAADAADRAVAEGEELGVFHGVPFTVKENIDVAGTPTTQGVPALADANASIDSPTVARMRRAGAIPFARTNLPDLGLRFHTDSSLHGLTRNPWDPNVTAGGSSGGEAAAIASGMSPIGLGNDIGGSLRNPAHCCGIASIKPTRGVVPMATVIPPEDELAASQQMLCEGPMARHVADVRAGLVTLAGWSPRDPRSVPAILTDLGDGERIRVAVMAEPPGGETHPEISAAIKQAGEILAAVGHDVVEAIPPMYDETLDLWAMVMLGDVAVTKPLLEMIMSAEAIAVVAILVEGYPPPTLQSSIELQGRRFAAMRAWSTFFTDHPVLVCPTWAQPAFAHGGDLGDLAADVMRDTVRPVLPASVLGLPAAVVPCGTAAGLPVGVQIMGDKFTDLRCLAISAQIEQAVGIATPIDPVVSRAAV